MPVATHIFPVQITWLPPPEMSLIAASSFTPAISYENTFIGIPDTSSVTGPIHVTPS